MSATTTEFAYLTVWNMNGGPVPSEALEALTEAVQGVIRATEEKSGVRLLHSVVVNDPAEVA